MHHMGWLRLLGSLKWYVSFADCSLFYRALLQKRRVILRSLLIVATLIRNLTNVINVSRIRVRIRFIEFVHWVRELSSWARSGALSSWIWPHASYEKFNRRNQSHTQVRGRTSHLVCVTVLVCVTDYVDSISHMTHVVIFSHTHTATHTNTQSYVSHRVRFLTWRICVRFMSHFTHESRQNTPFLRRSIGSSPLEPEPPKVIVIHPPLMAPPWINFCPGPDVYNLTRYNLTRDTHASYGVATISRLLKMIRLFGRL